MTALVANFDGTSKLITLTVTGAVSVRDIYSDWLNWAQTNGEYLQAMDATGGQVIDPVAGTYTAIYVTLLNGWLVQAIGATQLTSGVLLVSGGGSSPFLAATGQVLIEYSQPINAIAFSTSSSGPTPAQVASAVWAQVLEGTLSAEGFQKIMLAALAGKSSGVGTGTETYLAQDGVTSRITATFDSNNDRTGMVLNGTS